MGKTIRCDTCNRSYRTLKAVEALRDNDGVCLECENPIEVEDWDEVVESYDEEKVPAKKGAKKTAAAETTAKDEVKTTTRTSRPGRRRRRTSSTSRRTRTTTTRTRSSTSARRSAEAGLRCQIGREARGPRPPPAGLTAQGWAAG